MTEEREKQALVREGEDAEPQSAVAEEGAVEATPEEAAATDEADLTPDAVATAPPRRAGVAWLALVIAVVTLMAVLAGGWLGYDRVQRLAAGLGGLERGLAEQGAGLNAAVDEVGARIEATDADLAALRQSAQRRDTALEESLAALREQIGRDQSGWIVAEAEYLLRVANHRLRLEGDVDTALAALAIADQRLRETADPALIPVRERIAAERAALQGVARPDIAGLALRLAGLAGQVAALPLAAGYQPPPSSAAGADTDRRVDDWRGLVGAVWRDLKRLVTVRRSEEAAQPMLPPEQLYFLRQNLRLQLESARLALLRRDGGQLDESLARAREWVAAYFDPGATTTRGMIATLDEIAAADVRPALPDISGSLKALREAMQRAAREG